MMWLEKHLNFFEEEKTCEFKWLALVIILNPPQKIRKTKEILTQAFVSELQTQLKRHRLLVSTYHCQLLASSLLQVRCFHMRSNPRTSARQILSMHGSHCYENIGITRSQQGYVLRFSEIRVIMKVI